MKNKQKISQYDGVKPLSLILGTLTILQSICIILQAVWLAEAITALFNGVPIENVAKSITYFLLAFLARHLLTMMRQKIAYRYAESIGTKTRKQLLETLFQLGPRFARAEGTGRLVTLAMEGISQLRTFLELFIPKMITTMVVPIAILIYVFMQDIISGIILMVTVPIVIMFMILLGMAARKQMDQQWHTYRVLSNHFVDTLRGLETLKYLGQSKAHEETIARTSDSYRSATVRTLRVAFLSSFALDFFTSLSVAFVAVSLGLRLVDGTMTLGPALTILILAPEYFLPIREVGSDYHATLDGRTAAENIHSIMGQLKNASSTEDNEALQMGKIDSVAFSHIKVKHQGTNKSSLQDISFEINGPLKVGIVGESGAGKSTLIDVLGGFLQPTSGSIRINNSEANSLQREDWHEQITYIPQQPYLFHQTLADNVRFYVPDASREEVEQAVKAAGLEKLVESLPHRYDEVIGNGGRVLSGGQEQRVALARAFLSKRPMILLDEPTAHLDIETEYELKTTMLKLFAEKWVFLATHRLHWMPHMDMILVLDKGSLAEIGTHDTLVKQKGVYYELIRSQMEGRR